MLRDFESLENWELRIIEFIQSSPDIEISVVIRDGRINDGLSKINKNGTNVYSNSLHVIGEKILQYQLAFERGRYHKNFIKADRSNIIDYLTRIPLIKIIPLVEVNYDIISNSDIQKIQSYNLDLILKHGFNQLREEVAKLPQHGIWFLSHSDFPSQNGNYPGLWEILKKRSIVCSAILQLSDKKNILITIDKAYFNRHRFSLIETMTKVQESSVSLVIKNLNKLISENSLRTSGETTKLGDSKSIPLERVLRYISQYYFNLFNGMLTRVFGYLGYRNNKWSLYIGKGQFMESNLTKIIPIRSPRDEFWADPFIFHFKNHDYIFFENYSYKANRAKISCGKLENNEIIEIVDVLNLDYHLSYPFIFEEDGDIYLMPETSENKRLEIYRCLDFPNQWEIYTTAFNGEAVADAHFFTDTLNQRWLFLNKLSSPNSVFENELYIYQVDSIILNKIIPHKQNPVIIDSRRARNGGLIFEYQNKFYRPSQSNVDGIYGKSLNLNEIVKLTIDEYIEQPIQNTGSNNTIGLYAMHHLHQKEDFYIIDGKKKLF